MGNCLVKGFGQTQEMIKVVTSNGGIMEFSAPITAQCITNEFPEHAIFRRRDLHSQPVLHDEQLHGGEFYYLLPLNACKGHRQTRLNGENKTTPYRMWVNSSNYGLMKRRSEWKVKLVISPEQLSAILAEESSTEELIDSVRTVAKCGNGVSSAAASSSADSDQWSISSTWKTNT